VDLNTLSEEKRKSLEDEYFEKWVRDVDSEARSSDITECLKIFNEIMETYSDTSSNN